MQRLNMSAPRAATKQSRGARETNHELNRKFTSTEPPVQRLLSRLERVKETGPGRWVACCPAHDDRTPSLTVREVSDGTVLLKCWAGCGAADVVDAIGLSFADLFPERPGRSPLRRGERWVPRDVLVCLAFEATVVGIAADDLLAGRVLSTEDRNRLIQASARLHAAAREVGHG